MRVGEQRAGEEAGKVGCGARARKDKFTFTKVELEAQVAAALLDQAKGTRKVTEVPSKDAIVQVEGGEVKLGSIEPEFPQLVYQRLDGEGEKERPKGIPLLNTSLGGKLVLPKRRREG